MALSASNYYPYPGGYSRELEKVDPSGADYLRKACLSASRSRGEFEQLYEREAERMLMSMQPSVSNPAGYPMYRTLSPVPFLLDPPTHPIDPALLEKLKAAEPHKVYEPMPERIEPITAWRAWKAFNDNGWKLKAIGSTGTWEPKKAMEAVCNKNKQDHPAPGYGCECGIWSFNTLEDLVPVLAGYSEIKIIGQVAIWGRVIECEKGFRSSHAYPTELWILSEEKSLEQLGYTYGVPVRIIEQEKNNGL